jgi:hypothetical protein
MMTPIPTAMSATTNTSTSCMENTSVPTPAGGTIHHWFEGV